MVYGDVGIFVLTALVVIDVVFTVFLWFSLRKTQENLLRDMKNEIVDSRAKTIKALNKIFSKNDIVVPESEVLDDERLFELEVQKYVAERKAGKMRS